MPRFATSKQSVGHSIRKMFKLLMIAALATVAIADPVPMDFQILNPRTPNDRILGGEPVDIRNVPYQVSLQYQGYINVCGGSMISKDWVLTAAHCDYYPVETVTIRAGTRVLSSGGSTHSIKQFIKHDDFKLNIYGIPLSDVALIQVKTPFELGSTRNPIKMFGRHEQAVEGTLAMITGWGATSESGSPLDLLRKAYVAIVSKTVCNVNYKSFGGIYPGQICAGYPQGGIDTCHTDSGGPLTIGGRIAGITSWGDGCGRPNLPGIYTEIATYREWIYEKTGL